MTRTDKLIREALQELKEGVGYDTAWAEDFMSRPEVRAAVLYLVRRQRDIPDEELLDVIFSAAFSCFSFGGPVAWEGSRPKPSEIRARNLASAKDLERILSETTWGLYGVRVAIDKRDFLRELVQAFRQISEIPVSATKPKGTTVRGSLIDELTGLFTRYLGSPMDRATCGFANAAFPNMKPTTPASIKSRRSKR